MTKRKTAPEVDQETPVLGHDVEGTAAPEVDPAVRVNEDGSAFVEGEEVANMGVAAEEGGQIVDDAPAGVSPEDQPPSEDSPTEPPAPEPIPAPEVVPEPEPVAAQVEAAPASARVQRANS